MTSENEKGNDKRSGIRQVKKKSTKISRDPYPLYSCHLTAPVSFCDMKVDDMIQREVIEVTQRRRHHDPHSHDQYS